MTAAIAVPVQTKVAPFSMRRNASEERIKKGEEELEILKQNQSAPAKEEAAEENLSAEEATFKKRYSDLRRHSQKVENDLRKEVEELKTLVQTATEKQMKLPANEDDIDAWAKQYPDVYRIVESIAMKKAKETTKTLEERMRKVDESERNTSREKARVELLKLHPDFDKIEDSEDFHDWAEEQPKWVQDALYENDGNVERLTTRLQHRLSTLAVGLHQTLQPIKKASSTKAKCRRCRLLNMSRIRKTS